MLTIVEQAELLAAAQRAALELRDHASGCARCARADRRSLHANAYCPAGRAWLLRWRHLNRRVRVG